MRSAYRVFFDGTLCSAEIKSLVGSYITRHYKLTALPLLLYHTTMLDWLEGPVQRLAAELELECYRFDEMQQLAERESLLEHRDVLLLVPVVDAGEIIGGVVATLRSWNVKPANLRVLSVLSTGGTELRNGTCVLDGDVSLEYLLKVSQVHYPKSSGTCPMCRCEFPFTQEGVDPCHMLTSYDFWDMLGHDGLKEEDYVPAPARASLGKVPDLPRAFVSNGAWLAKKIGELVEHHITSPLNDLLVVCPKQHGAGTLTDYLAAVLGVSVVRVNDTGDPEAS